MLVKEFRIPVPVTVEEYKIAQLYMIQKKSIQETKGPNTGVEILKNEPFENEEMGKGHYTKKIYHIGTHIPSWIKALLPKSAFIVEEEAWNCYPVTKTIMTCPFISKLSVEMITHYLPDCGTKVLCVFFHSSSFSYRKMFFLWKKMMKDYRLILLIL